MPKSLHCRSIAYSESTNQMKVYEAVVRVVHMETWTVDAKDEADARKMFSELTEAVETDETGGEVVDWEVYQLREIDPETGQPPRIEEARR